MKIGFPAALTLLFIGLKLTHYIDWSWWYVTAPSWGIPAVCFAVWAICQVGVLVCELCLRIGETKEETEKRLARERLCDSLKKYGDALKR